MASVFNLRERAARMKQVILTLPAIMGNTAVNFYLDRFRFQGWVDNGFVPWKPRLSAKDKKRAILTKSGRLRRSIRITSISGGVVRIGTDVPYAKPLNEGFSGTVQVKAHTRSSYIKTKMATGRMTKKGKAAMKTVTTVNGTYNVKAHTRKMNIPARPFMGESMFLRKRLAVVIRETFRKANI